MKSNRSPNGSSHFVQLRQRHDQLSQLGYFGNERSTGSEHLLQQLQHNIEVVLEYLKLRSTSIDDVVRERQATNLETSFSHSSADIALQYTMQLMQKGKRYNRIDWA